jgi:FdhE protein
MARYLNPLVNGFAQWREEEYWLRNYCPMCGAPPAMGKIVRSDSASLRFLSCGCCGTRWRYPRTRCAFCESKDDRTMVVLAIDGENTLQIAYCDSCKGYLKTCTGDGLEAFLLADWTSLHLDVIALDRGLKRYAESRYQMPSFGIPQPLAL